MSVRHLNIVLIACIAVAVSVLVFTGKVHAAEPHPDPMGAIFAAAQNHEVDPEVIIVTARCESKLYQYAVGDNHTSVGLMQLSSLNTGLLSHFYFVGYTDWQDVEQQADYFARILTGEFMRDRRTIVVYGPNVGPRRWSCYRKFYR